MSWWCTGHPSPPGHIRLGRDVGKVFTNALDLFAQPLVFRHLALEKPARQARLLRDAPGRQRVGVGELVLGGAEAVHLHEPPLDQGVQAVIDAAEADAEFAGQLPLADVRLRLDEPHDPVAGVVVYAQGRLPRLPHRGSQQERRGTGKIAL